MAEVVIAIPSFRRPRSLERLLRGIEKLNTSADVIVLIADNDAEQREAVQTCERVKAGGYRWPIEAIVVAERGIANVRNALVGHALEHCDSEFIAMIDDDEVPDPNWLQELLRVQASTGADLLNGTTRRVFESDPGAWTTHCDGVSDIAAPTGPVFKLEGTGNLFMRRHFLEVMTTPWFDPAFALTGGEDTDFLARAKTTGARFAWANEAIVMDFVPPSRANLKWALSRAYSAGNSDMRVFLKYRPNLGARLNETARIAAALLLNPVLFVILAFNPNRRVRPLRKLYRAFGKLAAAVGRHYEEYSVIHGQ